MLLGIQSTTDRAGPEGAAILQVRLSGPVIPSDDIRLHA
jgi:hypothetical protein